MLPHWLIEPGIIDSEICLKLRNSVVSQGMEYSLVRYEDFRRDVLYLADEAGNRRGDMRTLPPNSCLVSYGSINFIKKLMRSSPWYPGAWINFEALKCSYYYCYWGKYSVQFPRIFLPFGDLPLMRDFVFDRLAKNGKVFVRPDSNDKEFTGFLADYRDMADGLNFENGFFHVRPETMVVVSAPQNIAGEWRYIIAERCPVTCSSYLYAGTINESVAPPKEVDAFVEELCQDRWQPDDIYVVDVCLLMDGTPKLVEIGSVNCAGLYSCNASKLVHIASELAAKQWADMFC